MSTETTPVESRRLRNSLLRIVVYVTAVAGAGIWWYFFFRPAASLDEMGAQLERDDEGQVVRLYLTEAQISDETLDSIGRFPRLRVVNLAKSKLPGSGFEDLAKLKDLKLLHLGSTNATDATLEQIGKVTWLRQLVLSDCEQVTDTGVQHLQDCVKLRQLMLQGTKVTDKGLAHLSKMQQLQELSLRGCGKVTDAGIEHLSKLKKLKLLYVIDTKITDEGRKQLARDLHLSLIRKESNQHRLRSCFLAAELTL